MAGIGALERALTAGCRHEPPARQIPDVSIEYPSDERNLRNRICQLAIPYCSGYEPVSSDHDQLTYALKDWTPRNWSFRALFSACCSSATTRSSS